jgi:hypothetical protein
METIVRTQQHMKELTLGGSSSAMLGGAAALVLSIVGLAGVAPHYLLSIAGIALGAGVLFEGGFIASEYGRILDLGGTETSAKVELGGGLSGEALAGIAAIVLGILSLLGIVPQVLMAIAAIVLGAGVVMGSGVMARLNALKIETSGNHETAQRLAKDAMSAAAGLQALVGLSAIVLGILALIGVASQTLTLVAMLALGAAALVSGGTIVTRVLAFFG